MPSPIKSAPPAPIRTVSPTSGDALAGRSVEQDKTGYLYVPRVGVDTAASVMGVAIRRAAGDKKPYTVIVHTEADKTALRAAITEHNTTGEAGQIARAFESGVTVKARSKGVSGRHADKSQLMAAVQRAVASKIKIKVNDTEQKLSKLDPDTTKLYVVGHGLVGGGGRGVYIKTDNDGSAVRVGPDKLAAKLKDGGLPLAYEDIRLGICHGSNIPSEPNRGDKSTGQLVANALGAAGFESVKVAAYPGEHLVQPRPFADGKLHGAVIADPERSRKPARASEAREIFAPETPSLKTVPDQVGDMAQS